MSTASTASRHIGLPATPAAAAVTISIIVPCWRGDAVPADLASTWLKYESVCQIVVATVDAGAARHDDLPGLHTILCRRPGRGSQMNEAARVATGNVLLFHHADTELTDAHCQSLRAALEKDPTLAGGAFRRQFDERHPHLRWLEPWEALRCRLFGPLFGDQSIFVRRTVFEEVGRFGEIPLMEDVDFSCRLRRHAPVALLEPAIRSSARKHMEKGRWRTTLANTLFLLLYVCGFSPNRLHNLYYRSATTP
jgi:hypothetical protein